MKQTDIDQALADTIAQYSGQTVAYKGDYPSESLVPVAYYVEKLTGLDPLPAGYYEWGHDLPGRLRPFFTTEVLDHTKTYPVGTILFWNTPHMAVVTEWIGSGTVQVFQQNADPEGSPCAVKQRPLNTEYYTCTHAMVPISEISRPTPVETVYIENTVDGIDYRRLQTAPQVMYVNKQSGADKRDFKGSEIATFRDFTTVPNTHRAYSEQVRIMGIAHHPIIPTGQDFYIDMDDWGDFTGTGRIAKLQGYLLGDLSYAKPPELPPVVLSRPEVKTMDVRTPNPYPNSWKTTYKLLDQPTEYVSEDASTVMFYDLSGHRQPAPLHIDRTAVIVGKVEKDGKTWLREGSTVKDGVWYCAPEDRLITLEEADALQVPTVAERLSKAVDPKTGKKIRNRFTPEERLLWIPFAWASAKYTFLNNFLIKITTKEK